MQNATRNYSGWVDYSEHQFYAEHRRLLRRKFSCKNDTGELLGHRFSYSEHPILMQNTGETTQAQD
jgi:hypothetical protein